IIVHLRDGAMRFNELRRDMGGVPQKSLSIALRALERDGFITRSVFPTIPPRVEYALAELGREVPALADWFHPFAVRHRGTVEAARARFDADNGRPEALDATGAAT